MADMPLFFNPFPMADITNHLWCRVGQWSHSPFQYCDPGVTTNQSNLAHEIKSICHLGLEKCIQINISADFIKCYTGDQYHLSGTERMGEVNWKWWLLRKAPWRRWHWAGHWRMSASFIHSFDNFSQILYTRH